MGPVLTSVVQSSLLHCKVEVVMALGILMPEKKVEQESFDHAKAVYTLPTLKIFSATLWKVALRSPLCSICPDP